MPPFKMDGTEIYYMDCAGQPVVISHVATVILIENWIDEAERRVWFLLEAGRTQGTEA